MANQTKFILALGIIWGILVFNQSQNFQLNSLQKKFEHEVKQSTIILDSNLALNKNNLEGIASLFNASKTVTREEFNIFVEPMLRNNKFIQALQWIPRISHSQRSELVNQAKRDGILEYQITERSEIGILLPAKNRLEYYPILYTQPLEGNMEALGFDLTSNPTRGTSLHKALDSGKPIATSKITLLQDIGKQAGLLIYFPLYQSRIVPTSMEERRQTIRGFITGVYRIEDMINEIIDSHFIEEINLVIFDGDKSEPESLLFGNLLKNTSLQIEESLQVEGRTWTLVWQANKSFEEFKNNYSIVACSVTVFIFALLAIIFQMNFSKTRKVEIEVQERTEELKVKNMELEEFTCRTSHDLRAPLVNIRGLSNIMEEDLVDGDYEEVSANIQKVGNLALKLESLVGDIVETARIDNESEKYEAVDLAKAVESIKESLDTLIDEKQIAVQLSLNGKKTIWTQRNLIQRVLENLISNAIKYSDPEKTQRFVKIEVSGSDEDTQIEVSDNGLGIPKEHLSEVFGMFKRFHKSSSFGSGLGLYLVKKNLEKINGKISLKSSSAGTVFTILLSAQQPASVKI